MRPILVSIMILSTLLVATAEIKGIPLIALRFDRSGSENVIWLEQRAKLGSQRVNGYIQAVGGRDDAIIGWELKDKWDALDAVIGYIEGTPEGRSTVFSVEADGKTIFTSEPMKSDGESEKIRVPIRGAKRILLRISSERYNETSGAAFGGPMLLTGLSEADLAPPLKVLIDGQSSSLIPPGGVLPHTLNVPLPLKQGEYEYKVRVKLDEKGRKATVTTGPGEPVPSVIE